MLPANTILQKRYSIVRTLGHGGMGTVYEALDNRVPCLVALKETLLNADEEGRQAFEREAGLLGNLHHRALPKVTDHFSENGRLFLVMEYIPGYDFAELMEGREVPFPTAQVLRWANTLFEVLVYLHERNPPVLHRDIKPSNLKLTKEGEIYLIDFGLAKGAAGEMKTLRSNRSMRYLTPAYAPLEQIHGQGTEPRSDLYSLSATIYYLLTGLHPVNAPTRFAALEDGNEDPLILITQVNAQVPAAIAGIIHRGMAISKKARPASAREMLQAMLEAEEEERRTAEFHRHKEADRNRREEEERQRRLVAEAVQAAESRRRKIEEERRRLQEEETRRELEARQHQAEEQERREESERQKREAEEKEARRIVEEVKRIRAEEQAALAAEEVRQRHEKKIRKREEPRIDANDAKHQQAKVPKTSLISPQPTDPSPKLPSTPGVASSLAIKTIEAPPPDRFVAFGDNQNSGASDIPGAGTSSEIQYNRSKLILLIAGVLAIVGIGAIVFWLKPRPTIEDLSANSSQVPKVAPTNSAKDNPAPPEGMVLVRGDTFKMGRDNGDEYERPAHQVAVNTFFIDIYEVTNEDYEKFVKAGNPAPASWRGGTYPKGAARKPVTGVSWNEATAYAASVGKRLPFEEEWEFAARGPNGLLYPWGNYWSPGMANAEGASRSVVEVGSYKGASPFGAYDMVGNVWEWTASKFGPYKGGSLSAPIDEDMMVIRGCYFGCDRNEATTTRRLPYPATGKNYRESEEKRKMYDNMGFRCVQEVNR